MRHENTKREMVGKTGRISGWVPWNGSLFPGTQRKILILIVMTFVQRSSAFLLTFLVYLGFGLSGTAMYQILLLQAAIYVAVDMLPVPGAQGITEAMYGKVFLPVFSGQYLVPAMCVTRGVGFYLMLVIGALWVLKFIIKNRFRAKKACTNA